MTSQSGIAILVIGNYLLTSTTFYARQTTMDGCEVACHLFNIYVISACKKCHTTWPSQSKTGRPHNGLSLLGAEGLITILLSLLLTSFTVPNQPSSFSAEFFCLNLWIFSVPKNVLWLNYWAGIPWLKLPPVLLGNQHGFWCKWTSTFKSSFCSYIINLKLTPQ